MSPTRRPSTTPRPARTLDACDCVTWKLGPDTAANAVIGQPARDAKRYFGVRLNDYFD